MRTETGKKLIRLAWLMWGTAMLAQCLNLLHRVGGATVADRLMAEFDISATALGTLMALLFYVYGAMQFPSGAMADSLGPRKTLNAPGIVEIDFQVTTGLLLLKLINFTNFFVFEMHHSFLNCV